MQNKRQAPLSGRGSVTVPKPATAMEATRSRLTASIERAVGPEIIRSIEGVSIKGWYSTGLPPLDVIVSGKVGHGIPFGRICELFGKESAGKTTLGVSALANAQLDGVLTILVDTEATFTESRAIKLKVDTKKLLLLEDLYLEPLLNAILAIVKSAGKQKILIFFDTIAGTPSQAERGGKVGEGAFGAHARALSQWFRMLTKPLAQSNVGIVLCNQAKDGAIGQPYAMQTEKDATLGGRSVRFHSEIRIRLAVSRKYVTAIGGKKTVDGFETLASVVKNKNHPVGGQCRLVFSQSRGSIYHPGLSCLYTMNDWKALGVTDKRIMIDGARYTESSFVETYDKYEAFRVKIHEMLETAYAKKQNEVLINTELPEPVVANANDEEEEETI